MAPPERVRVDKWLWAVRAFRTRSAATEACIAGRVTVNGEPAKAATRVRIGDEVAARRRDRVLVYGVVGLIEKRVSAAAAAELVDDRSPEPEPRTAGPGPAAAGLRDRGQGRPTKRDRRRIDDLRRRH